jgi:uncharacterized protein YbaP (TraB family)
MVRLLVALLLLTCALPVRAQNTPRTCLWQVRKPGTQLTSYLFGTFHEADGSFFASLPASTKYLAHADVLFVERRSEDMQPDEVALAAASSWNTRRWQSRLTGPQQATFTRFVTKAEDASFYQYSPLALRVGLFRLYEQQFCDTLARTSSELLDQYIERVALTQKTPVRSLDSRADRRQAFTLAADSLAEAEHIAFCVDFMQAMLDNDHSKCGSTQQYKAFELDYELEQSGQNVLGLLDRNTTWLVVLDQAFQHQNCFVAVGLRHLMYQQGLIQQLRRRGYTVTPVSAR